MLASCMHLLTVCFGKFFAHKLHSILHNQSYHQLRFFKAMHFKKYAANAKDQVRVLGNQL